MFRNNLYERRKKKVRKVAPAIHIVWTNLLIPVIQLLIYIIPDPYNVNLFDVWPLPYIYISPTNYALKGRQGTRKK